MSEPTERPSTDEATLDTESNARRPVGKLLGLGILLVPGVFSWFTLGKGRTTLAKSVSFGWLSVCILAGIGASGDSNTNSPEAALPAQSVEVATGVQPAEPQVAAATPKATPEPAIKGTVGPMSLVCRTPEDISSTLDALSDGNMDAYIRATGTQGNCTMTSSNGSMQLSRVASAEFTEHLSEGTQLTEMIRFNLGSDKQYWTLASAVTLADGVEPERLIGRSLGSPALGAAASGDTTTRYGHNLAEQLADGAHPACASIASSIRKVSDSNVPSQVRMRQIDSMFDKAPDLCLR